MNKSEPHLHIPVEFQPGSTAYMLIAHESEVYIQEVCITRAGISVTLDDDKNNVIDIYYDADVVMTFGRRVDLAAASTSADVYATYHRSLPENTLYATQEALARDLVKKCGLSLTASPFKKLKTKRIKDYSKVSPSPPPACYILDGISGKAAAPPVSTEKSELRPKLPDCPSGHRLGHDTDLKTECDSCSSWNLCEKEHNRLYDEDDNLEANDNQEVQDETK